MHGKRQGAQIGEDNSGRPKVFNQKRTEQKVYCKLIFAVISKKI
jgi:hypothetical protein